MISSSECNSQRWMSHWRNPASSGTFYQESFVVRCVCVWVMGKKNYRHKHQPTIPSIRAMRLHLRLRLYGRAGPDNAGDRKRCSSERKMADREREREDVGEKSQNRGIGRAYARSSSSGPRILQGVSIGSAILSRPGNAMACHSRFPLCSALHALHDCPLVPTSLAWLFPPLPSRPLLQPPFFLLQVAFSRRTATSDGGGLAPEQTPASLRDPPSPSFSFGRGDRGPGSFFLLYLCVNWMVSKVVIISINHHDHAVSARPVSVFTLTHRFLHRTSSPRQVSFPGIRVRTLNPRPLPIHALSPQSIHAPCPHPRILSTEGKKGGYTLFPGPEVRQRGIQ